MNDAPEGKSARWTDENGWVVEPYEPARKEHDKAFWIVVTGLCLALSILTFMALAALL